LGDAHRPVDTQRWLPSSLKIRHSVESPPHAMIEQRLSSPLEGVWLHLPAPSHALQMSHATSAGNTQVPSGPHAPPQPGSPRQEPWGSWSFRAQVPSLPATLHDWHCWSHAVSQQNPSTQWAERHWSANPHGWPLSRLAVLLQAL
jgi:hypothetical protein